MGEFQKAGSLFLTSENYFSLEAEQEYISCSQYIGFIHDCEAKTLAKIRGEYVEEKSTDLLVGSYVHAHFESPEAKKKFIAETPEMFLKNGGLKAEFRLADKMIEALENDEFCMYTLQGQSEVIITAEMFGLPWKIKIDRYNREKKRAVDIKTTKSIREHEWMAIDGVNRKVNFTEAYYYPLRASVYCEIERRAMAREEMDWLNFYLVAASKEDPPDKAVISMNDPQRYLHELEKIKESLMRIKLLKQGAARPIRCGKCDYCRKTHVVQSVLSYKDL